MGKRFLSSSRCAVMCLHPSFVMELALRPRILIVTVFTVVVSSYVCLSYVVSVFVCCRLGKAVGVLALASKCLHSFSPGTQAIVHNDLQGRFLASATLIV